MGNKRTRRDRKGTEENLVTAVGRLLARDGYSAVGINAIAREAGVDKVLIYRYFGGLEELVSAYALSSKFWPTAQELMAGENPHDMDISAAAQISIFFGKFLRAILARPETLEILAWEAASRSELTDILDARRERTALELFQQLGVEPPPSIDTGAIVAIMAGAVTSLALSARNRGAFGGLDLHSEPGLARVTDALELIIRKTFS